jgi:uncharacterized membrane protein
MIPGQGNTMRWFEPQRVFVVVGFIFGTLMALIVPPFQVPDEPHHFFRAYQISEGTLKATYRDNIALGDLPSSLGRICRPFLDVRYNRAITSFSAIREVLQIPLKPQVRERYWLVTAHYPPIGYLPQAIGIGIGRMFNWPPLVLMYIGRLTNLWTWIGLGYCALRTARGFGRPLLLLMLIPMSLFMAASLSADAVLNGLAFLLAALAFKAAENKGGDDSFVGWRLVTEFILCSSAVALAKVAYLPLAGLIFLIPPKRMGGARRFAIILAVLAVVSVAPVALWSRLTPGLDTVTDIGDPVISARRQLQFVVGHPKAFALIPILTAQRDGIKMILSLVGRLGWFNIQLSPSFVIAYLLLLLLACRPTAKSPIFTRPWRVIAIGALAAAASAEALLLMIDLIWTPVGDLRVNGLQGRYFIPIIPPLLLIAIAIWGRVPEKFQSHGSESRRDVATALIALAGCAYALIILYFHYYVSVAVGFV